MRACWLAISKVRFLYGLPTYLKGVYRENHTVTVCVGKIQFLDGQAVDIAALSFQSIALIVINMTDGTNTHSEGNNHAVVEKRQMPAL